MDTSIAAAFLPAPHACCGFDLAPFTLRHAFILEAVGSPIRWGARMDSTFEDLFSACQVCALRDEAEVTRFFNERSSAETVTKQHAQATEYRPHQIRELRQWHAYLQHHTAVPRLMESKGGTPYQCHPLLISVAKLMRLGHCSEEQAWWTPLAKARWLSLALEEIDPRVSFKLYTPELIAQLRRMGHNV